MHAQLHIWFANFNCKHNKGKMIDVCPSGDLKSYLAWIICVVKIICFYNLIGYDIDPCNIEVKLLTWTIHGLFSISVSDTLVAKLPFLICNFATCKSGQEMCFSLGKNKTMTQLSTIWCSFIGMAIVTIPEKSKIESSLPVFFI